MVNIPRASQNSDSLSNKALLHRTSCGLHCFDASSLNLSLSRHPDLIKEHFRVPGEGNIRNKVGITKITRSTFFLVFIKAECFLMFLFILNADTMPDNITVAH